MLLTTDSEHVQPEESKDLARLFAAAPENAVVHRMAQRFTAMAKNRRAEELDGWLDDASESEFGSFVTGLRQDKAAVHAALSSAWSNGQVEGQITKLKLLKRAMYGRAKLDLLRARLLTA